MKKLLLILALLSASCSAQMLQAIVGGGVATPPCTLSASVTTGTPSLYTIGDLSTTYYGGMRFDASFPVAGNVCKVTFKLTKTAGSITGKTFVAKIFSITGGDADTLLGTSAGVTGSDAWSATDVEFTFSSAVALSLNGTYGVMLTMNEVDAANYASFSYSDVTTYAGYSLHFRQSPIVVNLPYNQSDTFIKIYTQ